MVGWSLICMPIPKSAYYVKLNIIWPQQINYLPFYFLSLFGLLLLLSKAESSLDPDS
jgi:hypothetical protein